MKATPQLPFHAGLLIGLLATALTAAPAGAFGPQKMAPIARPLADRFPPPAGYSVEQDVDATDARNFWIVPNVRGHILRRFVQAGDDGPMSPAEIMRHYGTLAVEQQGRVLADAANNLVGRLDARIPGAHPIWLHVETADGGTLVDVIALEESGSTPATAPVEEPAIVGSWTVDEIAAGLPASMRDEATRRRDAVAAALAPALQPYRGWAWHVAVEPATSAFVTVRVDAMRAIQLCATCPVTIDAERQLFLRIVFNDPAQLAAAANDREGHRVVTATAASFAVVELPWMHGTSQISIYQRDLVDAWLASPALARLVQ